MPAAAVIPAPIAYIKVAAVKKLVVEFLVRLTRVAACFSFKGSRLCVLSLFWVDHLFLESRVC